MQDGETFLNPEFFISLQPTGCNIAWKIQIFSDHLQTGRDEYEWGLEHGKVNGNLRFTELLHWWALQVSWEVVSLRFWEQAAP